MGQGGKVKIYNNTDSRMIKRYEHSYQMDSWSFPDTIEAGKIADVYVEWDEGIFKKEADDAGEVIYYLEKDKNKEIEIHMWNCDEKKFEVTRKGFPGISSKPETQIWKHDGIMPIDVIDKKINFSKWMSMVDDNTPINKMSIPGTHDTLTYHLPYAVPPAYEMAKCQKLNISEQMEAGCRFFDLRFNHELQGRHGNGAAYQAIDCKDGLNKVMEAAKEFLSKNSEETLFMRMQLEGKKSESKADETYKKNIEEIYEKYKDMFWENLNGSTFPVLNDVRGKIVVLDNLSGHFFSSNKFGYDYGSDIFFIQDDCDDPEKEVKYNEIVENSKKPYDSSKMKVNYISANSGRLYPFDWWPEKYADYLNPRVINFFTGEAKQEDYVLGIIVFDFYDEDCGSAVISNNSFK